MERLETPQQNEFRQDSKELENRTKTEARHILLQIRCRWRMDFDQRRGDRNRPEQHPEPFRGNRVKELTIFLFTYFDKFDKRRDFH